MLTILHHSSFFCYRKYLKKTDILKWCLQIEFTWRMIKFTLNVHSVLIWLSVVFIIANCYAPLSWAFILFQVRQNEPQASCSSWISTSFTLVKAFAIKQVLPLMSKYKLRLTRLLRILDIKRRISYATWAEVDEQYTATEYLPYTRVRNPVIELAEICQVLFAHSISWFLLVYWLPSRCENF